MAAFGLCMYCYGVSIYTMPVFLLASCIYLLASGKVSPADVLLRSLPCRTVTRSSALIFSPSWERMSGEKNRMSPARTLSGKKGCS